jgi:hypothetical protein
MCMHQSQLHVAHRARVAANPTLCPAAHATGSIAWVYNGQLAVEESASLWLDYSAFIGGMLFWVGAYLAIVQALNAELHVRTTGYDEASLAQQQQQLQVEAGGAAAGGGGGTAAGGSGGGAGGGGVPDTEALLAECLFARVVYSVRAIAVDVVGVAVLAHPAPPVPLPPLVQLPYLRAVVCLRWHCAGHPDDHW